MKTNVLSAILIVGSLARAGTFVSARDTTGQPNPIISSPQPAAPGTPGTPNTPETQPSTGGRLGTAVENWLGKLLHRDTPAQVSWDQLPQPVQTTIRTQAGTAPIESISQVNTNGQTIYLVTFNRNGQSVDLQVDSAGQVVRSTGAIAADAPNPNVVSRRPLAIPDWRTAPVRQPLAGISLVDDFRSLPQPVQNVFLTYARGGAIERVQRGTIGGQTVYQARMNPNGQRIDLRVTDTGLLINDQVNDRFLAQEADAQNSNPAVGQAPGWQSGGISSPTTAPLRDVRSISFNQLPVAVQTTLSAQASGAAIERISQGTLDGRTVYDVSYNQGGQPVTVRLAEDGSVLSSSQNRVR